MIELGLTATQRRSYIDALHQEQDVRLRVLIFDANELPTRNLLLPSSVVLAGVVNCDSQAEVTRSLSLTLLDPAGAFTVDASSPAPNALFVNDLIGVRHETWVPELGEWIACPVFFGPLTGVQRDGAEVQIEAQGKEALHLAPAVLWQTATYEKGSNVVDSIRDLLTRAGERRFDMDASKHKLPKAVSVSRHDEPWKEAREMARGIDRHMFFDGRGRLRLRQYPARPVFTFYAKPVDDGRDPSVLTRPQISYNFDFRNIVEVVGPDPGGKKKRVRAVAEADATHPLSPKALAFNGRPRYLLHRVENSKVKRLAEAQEIADRLLADRMKVGMDVSFTALPMPFLEPGDMIGLVTEDEGRYEFRLRTFSFPLGPEAMSIGFLKRSRMRRRRKQKKGGKP